MKNMKELFEDVRERGLEVTFLLSVSFKPQKMTPKPDCADSNITLQYTRA